MTQMTESSKPAIDEVATAKWLFYKKANEMANNFQFDEQNILIINNMILYFLGIESEYQLHKGLYIYGPYGSGKTLLMKIFRSLLKGKKEGFGLLSASNIVSYFTVNGSLDICKKRSYPADEQNFCIDEVGAETQTALFYGTKVNVIQELLQDRYNLLIDRKIKTHITTNLTPKEMNVYGDRVRDRMKEMFNTIKLNCVESRRN